MNPLRILLLVLSCALLFQGAHALTHDAHEHEGGLELEEDCAPCDLASHGSQAVALDAGPDGRFAAAALPFFGHPVEPVLVREVHLESCPGRAPPRA
jgi:hypothetical protein